MGAFITKSGPFRVCNPGTHFLCVPKRYRKGYYTLVKYISTDDGYGDMVFIDASKQVGDLWRIIAESKAAKRAAVIYTKRSTFHRRISRK